MPPRESSQGRYAHRTSEGGAGQGGRLQGAPNQLFDPPAQRVSDSIGPAVRGTRKARE